AVPCPGPGHHRGSLLRDRGARPRHRCRSSRHRASLRRAPPGRPRPPHGALGLATAVALPGTGLHVAGLHAADLDPAAVACARRNVEPAGGTVYKGDLFAPLPGSLRGRAGALICNAPYVPTTEIAFMPGEARDHEALMALDGGADGLAILRRA